MHSVGRMGGKKGKEEESTRRKVWKSPERRLKGNLKKFYFWATQEADWFIGFSRLFSLSGWPLMMQNSKAYSKHLNETEAYFCLCGMAWPQASKEVGSLSRQFLCWHIVHQPEKPNQYWQDQNSPLLMPKELHWNLSCLLSFSRKGIKSPF